MSDRQLILETVEKMPESASFEEIMDELALLATVQARLASLEAGATGVPHEAVEKLLDQWITK